MRKNSKFSGGNLENSHYSAYTIEMKGEVSQDEGGNSYDTVGGEIAPNVEIPQGFNNPKLHSSGKISVQTEPNDGKASLDTSKNHPSEKSTRSNFLWKVYMVLAVQMIISAGIVALFLLHEGVRGWVQHNLVFDYMLGFVAFPQWTVFLWCNNVYRRNPVLLGLFTITFGVGMGTIACRYNAESVLLAAGCTFIVFVALTIFAFQIRWDFTHLGGTLFICFVLLFHFGFIALLLIYALMLDPFPFAHALGAFAVVLLSSIVVHDTQLMLGGNSHANSISTEEYIISALHLYLSTGAGFLTILGCIFRN